MVFECCWLAGGIADIVNKDGQMEILHTHRCCKWLSMQSHEMSTTSFLWLLNLFIFLLGRSIPFLLSISFNAMIGWVLRYQVLFCFDIQLCALNDWSGSQTIVSCSPAMFSHEIYSGVKVFLSSGVFVWDHHKHGSIRMSMTYTYFWSQYHNFLYCHYHQLKSSMLESTVHCNLMGNLWEMNYCIVTSVVIAS
jgi:hypothetical protein